MAKLEAPDEDTPEAEPQPQHDEPHDEDEADERETAEPAETSDEDKPDELELSAEDLDDDETAQEKPDRPDGQRYRVTLADGREAHLTIDELIQGNMLRSDYDRKRGQEAQERREREAAIEAERKAVATEREQLSATLENLKKLQQGGAPKPPDESLLDEESENYNPGLYVRQQNDYQKAQRAIQEAEAEAAKATKEQEEAKAAERAEYLKQQQARIPELIPAWTDGQGRIDRQKWERDATEMAEYAVGLGFDPQQVAAIDNAASLAVLRKAMLYDKAMAKKRNGKDRTAAPQPVRKKQVVVPSQATRGGRDAGDRSVRRAEEQFARRPDRQTGVDFLMAKMEGSRRA